MPGGGGPGGLDSGGFGEPFPPREYIIQIRPACIAGSTTKT